MHKRHATASQELNRNHAYMNAMTCLKPNFRRMSQSKGNATIVRNQVGKNEAFVDK